MKLPKELKAAILNQARAEIPYECCGLIASNQGGVHASGRETWGHSMIIDPWGEVLAEVENETGIAVAKIDIDTGRTHQIRVHSSNVGYPVCGDTEYGDRKVNEKFRKIGLKRIFLDSCILKFNYKGEHSFK